MESYCVGNSCLKRSGFKALVDSGSSFTYLPSEVYNELVSEVHILVHVLHYLSFSFYLAKLLFVYWYSLTNK